MYQIPKKQLAVKLSDFERNQLQEVSDQLQERLETTFSNGNHVVFGVLQELKSLENKVKSLETELKTKEIEVETLENRANDLLAESMNNDNQSEDFQELLDEAKEVLYGDEENTDEMTMQSIFSDLIEVAKQPAPEPKTIEKEVVKEVERELTANEILLSLDDKQIKVLELIARWRHSKKIDTVLSTPGQIIEGMVFNKPALLNWGEGFKTGIKRKNL